MKNMISGLLIASCLAIPAVFSEEKNGQDHAKIPKPTYEELVRENQSLKSHLVATQKEREDLKIALNELRAFMFRMNKEFERLDKLENKQNKTKDK